MRELTKEEIRWIKNELMNLNIKYFEVYNEIYDHIITSAEVQLTLHSDKSIKDVYFQIIANELDGYTGIQRIQEEKLKLFKKKLNNKFKKNLIQTLYSYKVLYLPLIFILFTMLFKLGKSSGSAIMAVSFLIAWIPDLYLYIVHFRKRQNYKQRLRIRKSLANTYANNISRLYYTLNIGVICILTISNPLEKSLLQQIGDNLTGQFAVSAFLTFLFLMAINIIQTIKIDYKKLVEVAYKS
jgi:hypothetical protein